MKFNKLYVYFSLENVNKIKILYGVSDDLSVLDFVEQITNFENYVGYSFEHKPLTKEEYDLILNKKITYCNCMDKVKEDKRKNYNSSLDFWLFCFTFCFCKVIISIV